MNSCLRYVIAMAVGFSLLLACGGPDAEEAVGQGAEPAVGDDAAQADQVDEGIQSHDDLVEAAAAEPGPLRVTLSMDEDVIPSVAESFSEKYPEIDLDVVEVTGSEDERVLLEVQSGVTDLDIVHMSTDTYTEYLPHMEQVDLLAMSEAGTLNIPSGMINPHDPYVIAAGSTISGIAWNPNLIEEELVPETYEDFLAPELKGRFVVDIKPQALAALWGEKGEDWVRQYASDIADQEPIWARGTTRSLTAIAAGEYDLFFVGHHHSAQRAMGKSPENLDVRLLEPVPVRLTEVQGIVGGSENVHSATLFLEHLADPETQAMIDELDPYQSSIHVEGSSVAEAIKGLETAVVPWEDMEKMPERMQVIIEEWGFPTAVIKKE